MLKADQIPAVDQACERQDRHCRRTDRGEPSEAVCVASATSRQKASVKMRDFDLLQAPRRRSEVDEQTRTSTIYGGTETGDFTRGGSARRDGERGVPTARIGGLGVLPMAGGGPGRLGGGAEAGCAAGAAERRS